MLREFFTTDYRGIKEILKDSSDLRKILELSEVPHYTTLQKAAQRITKKDTLDKLLREILAIAVQAKIMKKNVALSAIDGTGFESRHICAYFVKRKAKGEEKYQMTTYTRYPKVGIVSDCKTHLLLSGVPSRGPYPNIAHFEKAVSEAERNVHLKILTADAGESADSGLGPKQDRSARERCTASAQSYLQKLAGKQQSFPVGNGARLWLLASTRNFTGRDGRWKR